MKYNTACLSLFLPLLFFIPVSAQAATLTAHWKFDESIAGTTTKDAVGSNNGTPVGNPTPTTTVPSVSFADSHSMSFDGNNYFQIARPATNSFTICAWIKTSSTGGGVSHWTSAPIMDSESGGLANDFGFGIGNGGKLMFGNGGGYDGQVNGVTVINDNHWHNVCVTRSNTNGVIKLYVDALLDNTGTTSTGSLTTNPNARIGYGYDGAAHYVGLIDDVRVYDADLSQDQLENLTAGSDNPDAAPDNDAPIISEIDAEVNSNTSAAVTWTTDEAASTKVVYGPTSSYGTSSIESDVATRTVSHTKPLSGLIACTVYHYAVVSRDASLNSATSSDKTFITTGCTSGATPSSATSTAVSADDGGSSTLTKDNSTITVSAPEDFTSDADSVAIQVKAIAGSDVLTELGKPANAPKEVGAIVFDVKAIINGTTILESFDAPITISYTYSDSDVEGLDESTFWLYHYHNSVWEALDDCSVNTKTNMITCTTSSFSIFALFGKAAKTSIGSGTQFACRDASATNYETSGRHKQELCSYALAINMPAPSSAALCPWYEFSRILRVGDQGADVQKLQKLMNCLGFALAQDGLGSPEHETIYFADRTLAAVKKFQEAYMSEILAPIGESKGTGIFASFSQKKAFALTHQQ